MSVIILIALGLIIVYCVSLIFDFSNKKCGKLPPGPSFVETIQILKNVYKYNDLHIQAGKLSEKFGEVCSLRIFGKNLVFFNSAQIMRKVFASVEYREVTSDRPPTFLKSTAAVNGVIMRDHDEMHVKLRRILHSTLKLYGDGIEAFEEMVTSEITNLERCLSESDSVKSFDLDSALTTSLIRVVYIFLTNETLQDKDTEEVKRVFSRYESALNRIGQFDINLLLTLFPWLRLIPGSMKRICDEFFGSIEDLKVLFSSPERVKQFKLKKKGFVGGLYAEQERDPEIDNDLIDALVRDIVAAGFLTTKGLLSSFFLLLVYNPDVQTKIQQEIDEIVGERRPRLADRLKFHYTNAAVLETLRFIRHIPLGAPTVSTSEINIEGYTIPANSTLIRNLWSSAYSNKLWDDPEVFKPERFLDDGKFLPSDHPSRQEFLSFGTGKRNCLGETFAKSRIFLYVTSLLQKFTFLKGDNTLPSVKSCDWDPAVVLIPSSYCCMVKNRK